MHKLKNESLIVQFNPQGAFIESIKDSSERDLIFPRQEIDGRDRGGIPVCAPVFGAASEVGLSQHGFARNVDWQIIEQAETSVKLFLPTQNQQKQIDVPPQFSALSMMLDVSLDRNTMTMTLTVTNHGQESALVTPGFHPYFPVVADTVKVMRGNANLPVVPGQDVTEAIVFARQDIQNTDVVGLEHNVTLTAQNLPVTVVWSGDSNRYICVEPTMYGPITDKSPAELQDFYLAPGKSQNYIMTLDFHNV